MNYNSLKPDHDTVNIFIYLITVNYNILGLYIHTHTYIYISNCWKSPNSIIAIIRACACWALFVATLTNTVHLIYIYIYICSARSHALTSLPYRKIHIYLSNWVIAFLCCLYTHLHIYISTVAYYYSSISFCYFFAPFPWLLSWFVLCTPGPIVSFADSIHTIYNSNFVLQLCTSLDAATPGPSFWILGWTCYIWTLLWHVQNIYLDNIQGDPGFTTDCPWGVGCRGIIACILLILISEM